MSNFNDELESRSISQAFDKWRKQQSEEELKKFYENLDNLNNSKTEFLKARCRQMQKTLTPVLDSNEYDCKICFNSGQVFKVVSHETYEYIELHKCECIEIRKKLKEKRDEI